MTTRWSEALNYEFIKKYTELDVLWNRDNPQHKNLGDRRAALEQLRAIVNRPGISINDIRNKIKNLRSTYSQELKKMKHCSSHKPTLFWFDLMDKHLRPNIRSNPDNENTSNIELDSLDITYNSEEIPEEKYDHRPHRPIIFEEVYPSELPMSDNDPFFTTAEPETNLIVEAHLHHSNNNDSAGTTPIKTAIILPGPNTGRRRRADELREAEPSRQHPSSGSGKRAKMCHTPPPGAHTPAEDEFDIFCRSMAMQLRKLPMKEALQIQLKMHTMLVEARIRIDVGATTGKSLYYTNSHN